MGFVNDFKRWVSGGDVEDEDMEDYGAEEAEEEAVGQSASRPTYSEPQQSAPIQRRTGDKVVNINATTKLSVVLVRADQFNNVADIADHLKAKMTVVLNLESTDKDVSKRMLDFLSGVTYAIEGKIKRVSTGTYLITPLDVEIVGDDIISELENSGMRF